MKNSGVTSIRFEIDDKLAEEFKILLLKEKKSISTFMREAIIDYLKPVDPKKEQLVATKAVLKKATDTFMNSLHPEPTPVKSTGFSASLVNVEGKVKKIGDQYSILMNDGRSFLEDEWDFHLDGRTFDFRPMRPNTLFDISIFEISDQTPYLELVQIEKEKSDHTTNLIISSTIVDIDVLNEYLKGDDMSQVAPADFSDLPIPEFTRKV